MQPNTWARLNVQMSRCQAYLDRQLPPENYGEDIDDEDEPAWADYEPEVIDDADCY